jgi:hypothetical protein
LYQQNVLHNANYRCVRDRSNRAPIFCGFVVVIECPRIGRTRLVSGKNFLKIKYGVATLQKRAIFINHRPSNMVCIRAAIVFRDSSEVERNADAIHSVLTNDQ